jgi:hypothetical protein
MHDGDDDNDEAGDEAKPFPADPVMKDTPKHAQQTLHSSSRRGEQKT